MTRPPLYEGIVLALLVSALFTLLFRVFSSFWAGQLAMSLLLAAMSLLYLLYLLWRSPIKIGRPTVVLIWFLVSLASAWLSPNLLITLFVHVTLIGLMRALYFYSSVLMAVLDLGLLSLSMAGSLWALISTQSLFLALWSFFLLQALFVLIPERIPRAADVSRKASPQPDGFAQAYQAAQAALRQIASR